MRLNIIGYQYNRWDGYGRYAAYTVKALRRAGHQVYPLLSTQANAPAWLQESWGIDWNAHAVSILPPFALQSTPPGSGPHWLLTMTEGSEVPAGWADIIRKHNVERLIVPCQHNAEVFGAALPDLPISVVPGGTEPEDFPLLPVMHTKRPYTFLSLGDRGARKGWVEVWQAFYRAFGPPAETPDARLIIKARPDGNDMLELIAGADNPDPRITILIDDFDDMSKFYTLGDCFVIPSRSEGFGMPHREAAASGLPVITQRYSGMDDGHTEAWAMVVEQGRMERIPAHFEHIAGEWRKADVDELAREMWYCYACPDAAAEFGEHAAAWLRQNQTWDHSVQRLVQLLEAHASA